MLVLCPNRSLQVNVVDSLLVLIPMTVLLVFVVIAFFVMSVKSGQYDDMEGPAHRILMDDDDPMIPKYKGARHKTNANADTALNAKDDSEDVTDMT